MQVIEGIALLRKEINKIKARGGTVGLVPTMGYLHQGHLSLLETAQHECSHTVTSIFVNPLQFGQNEDFDQYPRNIARDSKMAEDKGCDLLFIPDNREIYPAEPLTKVVVQNLSQYLCGEKRPGHFQGVTTVVNILFNIVQPDYAFFGQKDAQQVIIIKKMVADLHIPVKIITVPTARDSRGLALSSRNKYLNEDEKKAASLIYEGLYKGSCLLDAGEKKSSRVIEAVKAVWQREKMIKIEYIQVVDLETLQPVSQVDNPVLVAAAVVIGGTRLIDNTVWPEGSLSF